MSRTMAHNTSFGMPISSSPCRSNSSQVKVIVFNLMHGHVQYRRRYTDCQKPAEKTWYLSFEHSSEMGLPV
jgi:hypothetical protein